MLIVQIEDGPGKALRLGLLPRRPFQRRENWGGSWSAEQAGKSLRLIICLLLLVKIGMRERRLGRLSQTLTKCLRKSCFSSLCHPWALPAVLHGASVKTCFIGCYPELRIASELGRKAVALEKEQREGGKPRPSLRRCVYAGEMDRREEASSQRVIITSEIVTRRPLPKCPESTNWDVVLVSWSLL